MLARTVAPEDPGVSIAPEDLQARLVLGDQDVLAERWELLIVPELLAAVRGLSTSDSRSANVVFSPIHGAGSTNVLPVLRDEGFEVTTVPEQIEPDEQFPTAAGDLINPEFREVMDLPIGLAEQRGADVAICSDPDADGDGFGGDVPIEAILEVLQSEAPDPDSLEHCLEIVPTSEYNPEAWLNASLDWLRTNCAKFWN